jgi:hypothetical protein
MRVMSSFAFAIALAVSAVAPATAQNQHNQSDVEFLTQRAANTAGKARKSGSLIMYDQARKKPGGQKAKGGGKSVEEGGVNALTHKLPSMGKASNPDTLGRVKVQFPSLPAPRPTR